MGRLQRGIILFMLIYGIGHNFLPGHPIKKDNSLRMTVTEALDMVQRKYATNFVKIVSQTEPEVYYYKLADADYYLIYEGTEEESGYYLIHLYEFVLDEPNTGIGHTVTYGWFRIDPETREIYENGIY